MIHELGNSGHSVNGNTSHHRRFGGVFNGSVEFGKALGLCGGTHAKNTAHGAHPSRKRQLTHKALALKAALRALEIARASENSQKYGYVEARALFSAVRGRKIDRHRPLGEGEAAVLTSGGDAILGFLYCRVGKSYYIKFAELVLMVALDGDNKSVDAHTAGAVN